MGVLVSSVDSATLMIQCNIYNDQCSGTELRSTLTSTLCLTWHSLHTHHRYKSTIQLICTAVDLGLVAGLDESL